MIERALAFIDGFCSEPDNYLAPTKLYESHDPRLYGQVRFNPILNRFNPIFNPT